MAKGKSRAARFAEIQERIGSCHQDVEELKDELSQWLENMPENLQQGDKAQELESAVDELDAVLDNLDEASNATVEFPGMR